MDKNQLNDDGLRPETRVKIDKLEYQIDILKFVVGGLIGISVLAGIFGVCSMLQQQGGDMEWMQKLDSLGSFLSGTAGALLALAGVFFVYSGLLRQQQQLLISMDEMKQTRDELKGQKQEMAQQNAHWELQRTEDTYFRLLANFQSIGVPSGNGDNKNHQVDYLGNVILRLAVGVPSSDDFETYRRNVSSRIEDWFLKPEHSVCLKIGKELAFIIKFLLEKENAEHLLEHICTTTTKGEKLLLFCYLFLDAEGIREIEDWYFDSEMLDRDINLNLRRLLSPTKVPPFSQEDIKNFEVF